MQAYDLRLLGIPRSRKIIAILYPSHEQDSHGSQAVSSPVLHADPLIVARVQP